MPSKSALKRAEYRKIAKREAAKAEYRKLENVEARRLWRAAYAAEESRRLASIVTMPVDANFIHTTSVDVEVTINKTNW